MIGDLDEDYKAWKGKAEATFAFLKNEGIVVRKVPVEISEFELWCRSRRRAPDGPSRASYVKYLLELKGEE